MNNRIVLQSVDSPRRDMEWRLFMAAKLAERGIASVIGSKEAIRAIHARSKNCVFLGRLDGNTGRTEHDKKYVKEMEKKGTAVFFLHDEGGLYYKGEYEEWVRRIYPEEYFGNKVFKNIFFWGYDQKKVFLNSPYKEKFKVTGFPRFDLCKPEFDGIDEVKVLELNKKYGDFILICGRFASVNMVADDPSSLGKRAFDMRIEGGALEKNTKNEVLRSMFDAWEKVSLEFSQFVPAVAKLAIDFPDMNFVLRPHPAERESFYKDAFVHFDNIFVDKSGDVRPYIRACKAIIHSECTTGLEAELNCKPNVNFRPCVNREISKKFEVSGVSDIGCIAQNYDELRLFIKDAAMSAYAFSKSKYSAECLIKNASERYVSSDLICNILEDYFKTESVNSEIQSAYCSLDFIKGFLMSKFKKSVKILLSILGIEKYKKISSNPGDLKFYEYSEKDIRFLFGLIGDNNTRLHFENGLIHIYPSL